ncbi:MAG: amidophosphoribosyltransferase [Oligoflexia bacterium]|nr:amidophosphoribosyltransferase [Oligoflexia bacterium]
MEELDKFREECGLIGIWNNKEAANLAYLGIFAQQHRGQEGAGVAAFRHNGETTHSLHKGFGLVQEVFSDFDFAKLPGESAIGHVRYTTAGGHRLANVQPFFADINCGGLAVAHNGNLVNADPLRQELIEEGAIFSATSDTEVFLHLLARSPLNVPLIERVINSLKRVQGAYSLLMLFDDRLLAVRDPNGLRPLCMGQLDDTVVFASETCAFDLIGARYVRDVEPGEIIEVTGKNSIKSYFPFGHAKESPCIFEYIYFARPDSSVFGRNVYMVRKRLGAELAKEHPVKADYVVPVPDSGLTAAVGYSQASGIPLEMGLIRNHYVGRTFIEPKQSIRDFGVKIKLNANADVLAGKSIVVVDDSIVRGTTSRKLVKMLRDAGAREVHMRISSPPTTDPCYYGIDTPIKDELIAARQSTDEIAKFIMVDSLAYLSMDGMYRAVQSTQGKFCDACFSGKYPIGAPVDYEERQKPLFKVV